MYSLNSKFVNFAICSECPNLLNRVGQLLSSQCKTGNIFLYPELLICEFITFCIDLCKYKQESKAMKHSVQSFLYGIVFYWCITRLE